ncbi:MAG: IclR family transcriptional regulator, partial [Desulfovibrionales bacterium]|nr:IclR family transcriptional regulator [Desulfovibrionales bacterium]
KKKAYYKISTLEKGLEVIELLAREKTLSVTEVAQRLGQNRSASHRFLATLHELGYVLKDERSRYRLSLKFFEIANRIDDIDQVRNIVRPFMRELSASHGETVNLGRLEGPDVVTIDTIPGTQVIKFDSRIGERSPAHTLGMGKSILAFRAPDELDLYIDQANFIKFTEKTITTKAQFRKELKQVRAQGYAMDDEEWTVGLRCVAIPVFNQAIPSYAISVSGPAGRMSPEKVEAVKSDLLFISRQLASKIQA